MSFALHFNTSLKPSSSRKVRAVVIENIVIIIKYDPESGEKPAYILRHDTHVPEA